MSVISAWWSTSALDKLGFIYNFTSVWKKSIANKHF